MRRYRSLLYIGLIVGTTISEVFCSGRLSDWMVMTLASRNNNIKIPEMRLWTAYPAIFLTAIGMAVWGVSVGLHYHWMVGQVALALCELCHSIILNQNTDSYGFYQLELAFRWGIQLFVLILWMPIQCKSCKL